MAYITIEDYSRFKDYIHPHINDCIDHYRHKNIINFLAYHGCDTINKNGTRKLIDYRRGSQYFYPTDKGYWRKNKIKIQNKLRSFYTIYITIWITVISKN